MLLLSVNHSVTTYLHQSIQIVLLVFSQGIEKLSKERPKRENREFNSNLEDEEKDNDKIKHISTRKLIGQNEDVYIMDAKSIGNGHLVSS